MQILFNQNKVKKTNLSLQKGWFVWLLKGLLILLATTSLAYSKPEGTDAKLVEYLSQEKNNLELLINESKQPANPANETEYLKISKQTDDLLALYKSKLVNFQTFLVNQQKLQDNFIQKLKQLQQFRLGDIPQINAQQKIDKINTLSEINKKNITLLNESIRLTHRYLSVLNQQKETLELWKSRDNLRQQLSNLNDQDNTLKANLLNLYEKSLALQKRIKEERLFQPTYILEARLLLNNQLVSLTQHRMTELNLQRKLAKADFLLLENPDIRTLQTVTDIYKNTITQLSDLEQSLRKMTVVLKNQQAHLTDPALKKQFVTLLRIINTRISGIVIQEQTLQEDLENHRDELKKQLSVRQSLSEYRLDTWPAIFKELTHIPSQFYHYLKTLTLKVRDSYQWLDTLPAFMLWLSLACIALAAFILHRLIKKRTHNNVPSRLSGQIYYRILTLFSRNIPHLGITLGLFAIFYLNHIPFSNYQLLMNLAFVWLIFRTLIQTARLVLLERLTDASGTDVRLYHRLKWLLLAGGWTTALMVFSDLLPLPPLLQDMFNRLFMLFLVAGAVLAWQSRGVVTYLLHPILQTKKTYIRHAVLLLVILIPMTLLTTAVIGLIGYINLAWTMSSYQVQLLMILSVYVLMRGLLFEAMEMLSEWMITRLNNGWLWIEVWLKPLDKILRLLLVLSAVYVLFQLFGWHSDSVVMTSMRQYSDYPLVNMSGIHITPLSILEFLLLLYFFMWAAKWTRELAYRWLYRDSRDTGIRNSLSVFTQYAVILIGGFLTLRTLGFDFSGMAMVLGGLAVGMGFGLRDFASNIVGGLMLLIERPVREGDMITIGGFEGQVSHIGIRSMRVSSWDNTEILIPNAETFNKPFTNWTHQDGIVRTVIPIKVSRADDPEMIRQLILDVLAVIPEIVEEPPVQVFLKQIDDALIEFEVRYFINVLLHTRFEIQSKVLFAIHAQFKAAGVKPPIPPLSVEVKSTNVSALSSQ